jgi:hypothetical protein
MRIWTGFLVASAIAGAVALSAPANAQDWCGFLDKANAQVKCGYSSLQECRQALSEKSSDKKDTDKKSPADTAVCLPDPSSG